MADLSKLTPAPLRVVYHGGPGTTSWCVLDANGWVAAADAEGQQVSLFDGVARRENR